MPNGVDSLRQAVQPAAGTEAAQPAAVSGGTLSVDEYDFDKPLPTESLLTETLPRTTVHHSAQALKKHHLHAAVGPNPDDAVALPAPFESLLDSSYVANLQVVDTAAVADTVVTVKSTPPAWMSGKEGHARPHAGGSDSGLLTVITLLMVVLALNFKYCPRIFSNFADELLSIRRRANVFDEHTTNESRVLVLMLVEYVAACSLLLYAAIRLQSPLDTGHIFNAVARLMGLMAGYYVLQLCAYSFVGYLFTEKIGRQQWVRGFNASQSLAGLLLLIPALITLFYPSATYYTLIVAVSVYLLARIVFIAKGFRIFFNKITACFYFILYLCTLEIIPALIVYHTAIMLVENA